DDELIENHEINVTPFIDVMLVLLIIFMVAAPLATVDIPVDLPVSAAKPVQKPDKPLYLTIQADKTLVLGDAAVTHDELITTLNEEIEMRTDTGIFFRADISVAYDILMQVMNLLQQAGYLIVALVGLDLAGTVVPWSLHSVPALSAGLSLLF